MCKGTPANPGKSSGRTRLWAFGYPTLAALLNTTEGAVRQLVHDPDSGFDPSDLESVFRHVAKRRGVVLPDVVPG